MSADDRAATRVGLLAIGYLAMAIGMPSNHRAFGNGLDYRTVAIKTNAASLSLVNGLGQKVGDRHQLKLHGGANELQARAPGYYSRRLVVWRLTPTTGPLTITMKAAKNAASTKLPPLGQSSQSIAPSTSLCRKRPLAGTCWRETLAEDLLYSGYFSDGAAPNGGGDNQRHNHDMALIAAPPSDSPKTRLAQRQAAEDFLNRAPDNPAAFAVAAQLAFFSDDCPRVLAIFQDAQHLGQLSSRLWLSLGLCYEAAGKPLVAAALWQDGQQQQQAPWLAYNQARVLVTKNPIKAARIAQSCQQRWPTYYPCAAIGFQIARVRQQRPRHPGPQYRANILATLKNTAAIMTNPAAITAAKAAALGKLRRDAPQAIEGLAWQAQLGALSPLDLAYLRVFTISHLNLAAQALKQLKTQLPPESLRQALIHAANEAPTEPRLWWELLAYLHEIGDCRNLQNYRREAQRWLAAVPKKFAELSQRCQTKGSRAG